MLSPTFIWDREGNSTWREKLSKRLYPISLEARNPGQIASFLVFITLKILVKF